LLLSQPSEKLVHRGVVDFKPTLRETHTQGGGVYIIYGMSPRFCEKCAILNFAACCASMFQN
jgi:hypothetical protein